MILTDLRPSGRSPRHRRRRRPIRGRALSSGTSSSTTPRRQN